MYQFFQPTATAGKNTGKVNVAELDPITFDPANHVYLKLGAKVDDAFKVGLAMK